MGRTTLRRTLSWVRRDTLAELLPPVLAAFIASVLIVVRPIAQISGSFGFLVSTLQFLYFYPAGTLSALVETTSMSNDSFMLKIDVLLAQVLILVVFSSRHSRRRHFSGLFVFLALSGNCMQQETGTAHQRCRPRGSRDHRCQSCVCFWTIDLVFDL